MEMAELSSFERAALPHMDAAFNLAFWLVRNRADAEDVVQDAYLRAFRAQASLKGDDMRPWLLTIVRNVAYRALAKRGRAGNVISFDEAFPGRGGEVTGEVNIAADTPSAEALLIGDGDRTMVISALAELPPAFREVVVLREMEGLPYREIAAVTGVPIGTVMSRLSRARSELKTILTRLIEKDASNAL
jgi:RNA polymerase sigma-70 factor, ECF subfamily